MASEKITAIVEEIKGLTILELNELVKAVEEEFGVSAAAPVAVAGGAAAAAAPAAEEKTEFDVVLTGFGDKKLGVIKVIREITGLGLPEERQGGHLQGRCRETQGAAGCRRRYRRDQVISAHVYPHSAPRGKGRGVRSCCRKALFSCRRRALFARVGEDYRFPVRLGGLPSPPSAGSAGSSVR